MQKNVTASQPIVSKDLRKSYGYGRDWSVTGMGIFRQPFLTKLPGLETARLEYCIEVSFSSGVSFTEEYRYCLIKIT